MSRRVALFVCLTAVSTLRGSVQLLPALPNAASSTAMQLDAAGNIYLAGSFTPASKSVLGMTSAFVAKVSADGSKLLYFTALGGSSTDAAFALAVGSDGSAYVTGNTNSSDFPVTAGALQSTYIGGGQNQGFLAKVNPAGSLAYATFINGTVSTQITGMALDGSGDVFLTGIGGPGAPLNGGQPAQGFILELNAGLSKVLLSIYGYGGGRIVLDSQGNIYVAGSAQPAVTSYTTLELALPPLPAGAFQSTHAASFCYTLGSGPGGPGGSYPCNYQYVAKLDPTGAPLWATYVTGTYGAIVGGMAVDSAGNVIVAGTTYSDDYPVTPGAFQTAYAAAAASLPVPAGSTFSAPPPATGYVSKINATGTALIWSTYFGGSYLDEITGMAVGPTGEIFVSGKAASSDLPAVAGTPDSCRPSASQELGFVTRLAPDGTTAGPTQLVQGAPDCSYFACSTLLYDVVPEYPSGWPLVLRSDGTALLAGTNGTVAAADFSSSSRLSCVVDPADYVQLSTVAPGQLLTLFGTDLAPTTPFIPPTGVAASTASFGVYFNGIPAPILYSAAQQVNVQVPYEIAGQTSVQMQVVDQRTPLPTAETLTLGVVERQAAVFLTAAASGSLFPGYTVCNGAMALGSAAVALNADGSLNDCNNPAAAGSVVTILIDGLGPVTPALVTGTIAAAPPVFLTPGVVVLDPDLGPIPSTTLSVPGAIAGVAQVQVQLPKGLALGPYALTPTLAGIPLRERLILIWTRPD